MARRLHGALGGLSRPRSLNLPRPWPRRTLSALAASAWHSTTPLPSDPILGLVAAFKEDTAAQKVNLAQGAYRTDTGTPFVLDSVKEAERRVAADLRDGRSDKVSRWRRPCSCRRGSSSADRRASRTREHGPSYLRPLQSTPALSLTPPSVSTCQCPAALSPSYLRPVQSKPQLRAD